MSSFHMLFVKCFPEHFLLSVFWFYTNTEDDKQTVSTPSPGEQEVERTNEVPP